jgi:hypothetical protein
VTDSSFHPSRRQEIPVPDFKKKYTDDDFATLGFHDCYVSSITWDADTYSFALFIDYILKWVEPLKSEVNYQFWISPAQLRFVNVDDVELDLRWNGLMMDCIIDDLQRKQSRVTPNGARQHQWEFLLSEPNGSISLWATNFELTILAPPTLTDQQCLTSEQRACRSS